MNKDKAFQLAIDARLSGLTVSPQQQMALLRRAQEEQQPVKKKISVSLAFALALLLALAASACAAAVHYGVLDFNSDQANNAAFIEHIVSIGQTYESEYFTLTVNEAVFDGAFFSMTMDIVPVEGAPSVYVKPIITAQAGDTQLDMDIEGCTGGDFWSGFWVPQDPEWGNGGHYGVDCVSLIEEGDTLVTNSTEDAVTWTVSFDVIRPEWPISVTSARVQADDVEDDDSAAALFEDYMQTFRDGYANEQIVLSPYYDLVEFVAVLPAPEGMSHEEWISLPLSEQLVRSGAFSRVDTLICNFTTDETRVHTVETQTFDLGDYEVTLERLSVTFSRADYTLSMRKKPGHGKSFREEMLESGFESFEFAVLSSAGPTSFLATSASINDNDESDLSVSFSGTVSLSAPTDTLTFVAIWDEDAPKRGSSPAYEIMHEQKPLTDAQEAMSFTVTLE